MMANYADVSPSGGPSRVGQREPRELHPAIPGPGGGVPASGRSQQPPGESQRISANNATPAGFRGREHASRTRR